VGGRAPRGQRRHHHRARGDVRRVLPAARLTSATRCGPCPAPTSGRALHGRRPTGYPAMPPAGSPTADTGRAFATSLVALTFVIAKC
jgi:hypothetical protein